MMKILLFFLATSKTLATLFLRDFEDPCVRLCDEFTADRRGAGFNLCDTERSSQCELRASDAEFCSNLYWSSIDGTDERGLVYDAVAAAGDTPVSCLEAASTANAFLNKFFHAGLEVFINFRPVMERVTPQATNGFLITLREYLARWPSTPKYSLIKELQDHVNVEEAHSILDIVVALFEAGHMTEIFFDTQLTGRTHCNDCGNTHSVDEWTDTIILRGQPTQAGQEIDLTDLLWTQFLGSYDHFDCPACNRTSNSLRQHHFQQLGEIFAVQIEFNSHGEQASIPDIIDMAPYVEGVESPYMYELVAVSSYGVDAAVRRSELRWDYVSETRVEDIDDLGEVIAIPRTDDTDFETFYYQRVVS